MPVSEPSKIDAFRRELANATAAELHQAMNEHGPRHEKHIAAVQILDERDIAQWRKRKSKLSPHWSATPAFAIAVGLLIVAFLIWLFHRR